MPGGDAGYPPRPGEPSPAAFAPDYPVAAAVEGDAAAVARLLAAIRPLVMGYCRARLGRPERSFVSADDVAQEVCLAVLTALPNYRDSGSPFLAFVYGIASHKVADALRAAARNRAEPVPEVLDQVAIGNEPEIRAVATDLGGRLNAMLRLLPPVQRRVVVMRIVIGLSAEETAGALGISAGSVRTMQHRGLHRLRQLVAHEEL
jgi:RNA polymerase sigma-70 factor (ECF subfamily)